MALIPCPSCGLAQPDRLVVCQRCGANLQPQPAARPTGRSTSTPIETTVVVPRHPLGPSKLYEPARAASSAAPSHQPTPFTDEESKKTDPNATPIVSDEPTIVRRGQPNPATKLPSQGDPAKSLAKPESDQAQALPQAAANPTNHTIAYGRRPTLARLWLAWLLDGLVAGLPSCLLANFLVAYQGASQGPSQTWPQNLWQYGQAHPRWTIGLLMLWMTCAMMSAIYGAMAGATLGQRLCQLTILHRQQTPVPLVFALWRAAISLIGFGCGGAGFFWSMLDQHHRPWHDLFSQCQTIQRLPSRTQNETGQPS